MMQSAKIQDLETMVVSRNVNDGYTADSKTGSHLKTLKTDQDFEILNIDQGSFVQCGQPNPELPLEAPIKISSNDNLSLEGKGLKNIALQLGPIFESWNGLNWITSDAVIVLGENTKLIDSYLFGIDDDKGLSIGISEDYKELPSFH